MRTELDVLVIGAGQAGLAMGRHLLASGLRFALTESHARIGDSWRDRYDSLTLFTPRNYSALPGLPMDGDPEGYATRDEFADYLERYAEHHRLPVRLRTPIVALHREGQGFLAVTKQGEAIEARAVVIASGAFQVPRTPAFAKGLSEGVAQFTAATYRRPSQIPDGVPVVVVGDGATGLDIAGELASTHPVILAAGKPRKTFAHRTFGKSFIWWLDLMGALRASPDSFRGSRLKKGNGFPIRQNSPEALRRKGVRFTGRVLDATGDSIRFQDGTQAKAGAVIWAMGYSDDSRWVQILGAADSAGNYVHTEGVSPVPGLFFVGRPWQRSRASSLVCGADSDSQFIANKLIQELQPKRENV